ncbi:hypothetical protein CO101_03415 [Candidatus Berkelbacteria bacterium CG_4_9_14_3_um_filter_39_23]|uniref:Uncharacterized protein n=2 Tax=Candidatus Berkelbacteria TaxID=1618330 RepID=A0A2M7CJ46_9BACT|nr:hypothetical protein [Candidatus Berkelbacteria bacterium]OIP05325.1 MAG: hypothetical protein AUK14_01790 [Candidatus Berkelbacteria bacterium CG2_30_39_44]PIR27901.1 MAG: hypothetical protein COV39_01970 [Candidatus Berkelbacteria bacterium CG11_big_fil_rev_8_21_14_0_20_40_23]PIV25648.1 MAG: hypothetical protein COS38_00495 [Candidatus Berkelbacteria bacterium CG03_land_8_20_14_0_80_40_36]PIX30697.1 MAG: hypothetical protein COZ62_01275 [Candidatus Berkelbacteria bacterium CG_4_8_14_3_um_f
MSGNNQNNSVNKPIEVLVKFSQKNIEIKAFKWNGRVIKIDKINLRHTEKRGEKILFYFNVSNVGANYELTFDNQSLGWKLKNIY